MSDKAALEFGCPYVPAYSNRCNRLKGESGFCSQHTGIKCCVCGKQATNECNETGQFVCGARLCDDCEGYREKGPSGAWGLLNHDHREKPPEKRRSVIVPMTKDHIS